MPYLGRGLEKGNYLKLDDISSQFDGSKTTFNLTVGGSAHVPGSSYSLLVSLSGIVQEGEAAYTLDQNEITFAAAPQAADDCFIISLGTPLGIGVPSNGTVNGTQLAKPLNYDNFFHLDHTNDRVGIGTSLPTQSLDVYDGNIAIRDPATASQFLGFYHNRNVLKASIDKTGNNLTFENVDSGIIDYKIGGDSRVSIGSTGKIFFGTDDNTYFYRPGADTLGFLTGGTERLRITSGGEVLIGTTTDANVKLDVEGSLRAKSAGYVAPASGTGLEIYYATNTLNDAPSGYLISYDRSSSAYKKINYDASEHRLRISGTERLHIGSTGISTFTNDVRIVKSGGPLLELTTNTGAADATLRLSEGTPGSTTNGGGMFYSGADNKLHITCGTDSTTKRITILRDDGKVGIGVTNPDAKLEVRDSASTGIIVRSNSTQATDTNKAIRVRNNSDTNTFHVSHKGQGYFANNVGIGTTNPASKLTIFGGSIGSGAIDALELKHAQANNSGDGTSLLFNAVYNNNPWAYAKINAVNSGTGFGGDLQVHIHPADGTQGSSVVQALSIVGDGSSGAVVRIPNGKVGIGTDNPYYKLDVNFNNSDTALSGGSGGNWGGAGLRLENENTTVGSMSLIHFRSGNHADWHVGTKFVGSNNSDLVFLQEGVNEKLRIKNDGKVGIGTHTPARALHLHDDDSDTVQLHITNATTGATSNDGVSFLLGSDESLIINQRESNRILLKTDDTDRMVITSDGDVGIGTISPLVRLEVEEYITTGFSPDASVVVANNILRLENKGSNSFASMMFRTAGGGDAHFGSYQNLTSANDCTFYFSNQTDSGGGQLLATLDSATGNFVVNKGKVGIGTTVPGKLLELFGTDPTIKLRDSSGDAYALIEGDSADGGSIRFRADPLSGGSDTHIRFDTDGNERLRIDSNGRIKIGTISDYTQGVTNNPVYIEMATDLTGVDTAEGAANTGLVRIEETGSNPSRYHGIELRNRQSGDIRLLNLDVDSNNYGDFVLAMPSGARSLGIALKMRFNSVSDAIQIAGKGGATLENTAVEKTDIYLATKTAVTAIETGAGTAVAGLIRFEDKGSEDGRYHGIEIRNRNNGDVRILNLDEGATNKSNLVFATDNGSNIYERLRIASTGNVSIGAQPTSGTGLFNIKPKSADDTFIKFRPASDFDPTYDGTAIDNRNNANNANRDLIVRFNKCSLWPGGGSDSITINNVGAVTLNGNGTKYNAWAGGTPLNVTSIAMVNVGNADTSNWGWGLRGNSGDTQWCLERIKDNSGFNDSYIKFRVYNNGNYLFAGSDQSDRDVKENILDISGTSLDKIKQLKPRTFNFIESEGYSTETKTGFIAQEVASVIPSITNGTDGQKDMGVDYNGLVAHLVKALQEATTEIETLKTKVAALEGS